VKEGNSESARKCPAELDKYGQNAKLFMFISFFLNLLLFFWLKI